jgi:YD repeat-containing protein
LLDHDRSHNEANEITGITTTTGPSWIEPAYDDAGNMTEAPSARDGVQNVKHKYIFDAWNRLVKVRIDADIVAP